MIDKNKTNTAAEILLALLKALAAKKDEMVLTPNEFSRSTTFSIKTSQKDYGRVIGAKGKNVKCFELFAKLLTAPEGIESQVSVVNPEDRAATGFDRFTPNPSWGKAQIIPLLKPLCEGLFKNAVAYDVVDVDPKTIHIELKVAMDERFYIIQDGEETDLFPDFDPISGHEVPTPITIKMVGQKIRTIFHAIGKNNGRNIDLELIEIDYSSVVGRAA